MKEHKTEHYNFEERVDWKVSTGSLLLDIATGGVSPALWRLCGNNNCGKTPQALEIVRNIFEGVPNSKCLWVIAEGRGLSEENKQRCGLKFVYDPKDWEINTVFVLESNIYELFIKVVRDLVRNNPENIRYAMIVDSMDGLILRDDSLRDITENSKVCGPAALSKKMLQSLSLGMFKYGHWMGLISQVTSEIKIDPYAKTANRGGQFSGGNALLHTADIILQWESVYNGDFILNNPSGKMNDGKSTVIGQHVPVTFVKSSLEASKRKKVVYPIRYGKKPSAIWKEREITDILLTWNLIERKGSWVTAAQPLLDMVQEAKLQFPDKVQGLDKIIDYLEENSPVTDFLFKKFKETLTV